MTTIRLCMFAAVALALAGCNANQAGSAGSAAPQELSVAFNWCGAASPSFRIGNIPEGASKLRLRMTDRHVPSYNHGGGEVPVAGGSTASIPCGRLVGSYNGPNPPAPQVHDYEWTVTALDANGKVIARGSALRKFPE
ncbi:hypothetical protein [Pseudochelatococcus contaminans]|uniref:Phospholipid-binding protein n=1 Tax=Pseudochelatococcus contaminans TaxID=1538103 RepID=A0A7W5Z3H1_9HYPH|nr:hypothetical protein [Pseudochelatococcus contaminans]MBB3809453.1 hypothetical protein [Pseudochelatococcus contaminans]